MSASVSDDYIYLDYAATAPLCEEAARAMQPYWVAGRGNVAVGGNANSLHSPGRRAFEDMEQARRRLAHTLGARRPDEIVFTSGATEADNAALLGLAHAALDARRRAGKAPSAPHVITTAIEHGAVLEPARRLEAQGFRVTRLQPTSQGFIECAALEAALDDETVLVSVQAANSEVGSIQPIAKLAALAHGSGALFHTDATQALGKVPLDLGSLDVDAASFSAHKIGGPKGTGALYVRARTPFEPFMLGGGQESGRRSTTQNVAGIVGFEAACAAAVGRLEAEVPRLQALRDGLYARLSAMEGLRATVRVASDSHDFLPNIVHVLAQRVESETMILRLDMAHIGVSGGSACSSHSLEPSHVLKAMGISSDAAHGALRISMGRYTTERDIDALVDVLPSCLEA